MTYEGMIKLLKTGRVTVRHPGGGRWVDPQVRVEVGCTEHTFQLCRDGWWRYVWVNTYGNLVTPASSEGQTRDASGVRIAHAGVQILLDRAHKAALAGAR
jgi:hypothetical protein